MKNAVLLLACVIGAGALSGCKKTIDIDVACAEILRTDLAPAHAPERMEILASHGIGPAEAAITEQVLSVTTDLDDLINGLAEQSEKFRADGDTAKGGHYAAWSSSLNECYALVPTCLMALEAGIRQASAEEVDAMLRPVSECVESISASMRSQSP